MTHYFQHTSPKEWSLADAFKAYKRDFPEVDVNEKIIRELISIKQNTKLKLKRDMAEKLLKEMNVRVFTLRMTFS